MNIITIGPTGEFGDTGDTGDKGNIGDTGSTGDKGLMGDLLVNYNLFNINLNSINNQNTIFFNSNTIDVDINPSINYDININLKGNTGETGSIGSVGNTGNTGDMGDTGDMGIVGATGSLGLKGNTGSTGPIGNTGIKGIIGDTGLVGNNGLIGPFGETGNTGSMGSTGSIGNIGDTGFTGPTGNTGSMGVIGNTGSIGNLGPTGVNGLVGDTGSLGLIGNTGDIGTIGITGVTGPIGAFGNTGGAGPTRIGPTGINGVIGVRGSTGSTGPTSNIQGVTGPINNIIPIILDDTFIVNAGFTGTFNVLANDIITAGVSGINAGGSLALNEGRFLNNTISPLNFIPAPRLLTSGSFNYFVNDGLNVVRSGFGKLSVRLAYLENPIVYTTNGTNNLFRLNCQTGVTTLIKTFSGNIGNIAASVPDSLLYFTAVLSPQVQVFNPINDTVFNLININTLFGIPNVAGMGFDNKRFLLYLMNDIGTRLVQVGVYPYKRYDTPSVQNFTSVQKTPLFSIPLFSLNDIAVDKVTGYLYITCLRATNLRAHIIKYDFINNVQLAIADVGASITIGHIAFGSDDRLYISSNAGNIRTVDPTTLALGPPVATNASRLGGDLSEPLYFL